MSGTKPSVLCVISTRPFHLKVRMKRFTHIPFYFLAAIMIATIFSSCQDDISDIGNSLTRDEVVITIDSVGFRLSGKSVAAPVIDARSTTNMIGEIDVPEYGRLKCSFVARLLSATNMNVPDSIPVDSVCGFQMKLTVPRSSVTGDSLAPQKLQVYELTKQLPDSITNAFDPTGYYTPESLLGTKSYTASAAGITDTKWVNASQIKIPVDLSKDKGVEIFKRYRENPETFSWPATFAKYFPGVYVDNNFGRGCVMSISQANFNILYKVGVKETSYNKEDSTYHTVIVTRIDTVTVFATAPEVLSSNNISLRPSSMVTDAVDRGEVIIQSPAGYNATVRFPAQEIIDKYREQSGNLSVINNLSLSIPAVAPDNDFGIGVPPSLLMVKTSEMKEFFEKNKIPDDKTSFWANYSDKTKSYAFSSMRDYIVELIEQGNEVDPEDMEFTLVPVLITTETDGSGSGSYVTACTPYQVRPAFARLDMEKAEIRFTFSRQQIY